jgi:hypothetical protein
MHEYSEQVALYANSHLELANAKFSTSYFYHSIPLCVVDAIFSVGVKYRQVENVVEYLCKQQGWKRFRGHNSSYPPPAAQAKITDLFRLFAGLEALSQQDAKKIFNNQGYINPRAENPTLKAEICRQFAAILMSFKIETFQDWDLISEAQKENVFRNIVKAAPALKSGVIMRYFSMLAGDENQVKPDRWILRFLRKAVIEDDGSVSDPVMIIRDACTLLNPQYPNLTPRLLDHMIWKFQSQNKNNC